MTGSEKAVIPVRGSVSLPSFSATPTRVVNAKGITGTT